MAVNEVVVLGIIVPAVAKLSVDNSHLITLPVLPLNVNTVLFVPVHIVALPLIVPPMLAALTVTVATELMAVEHGLLCTTAR